MVLGSSPVAVIIFCIFLTFVFFVILLRTCLTKFESIKLKCYFTTLLYAIAVNMVFLEFSSKRVFLLTILSMPVSSNQYRGEIGSFSNWSTSQITEMTISLFNILMNFTKNALVYIILLVNMIFLTLLDQFSSCNIIYLWNFMTHLFYYRLLTSFLGNFSGKFDLLMLCGDIESNPGPRPNSGQSFSICHWNLNSIAAHNFSKISLLRAYNAIHNYDIICLSETYLNHDTLSDSDNLKIPGYELIRVDHPSNQKRGGICIYHKDFLPIKVNNVSCLKECFNFSLSVYGKQCNITLIIHQVNHQKSLTHFYQSLYFY